MVELTKSHDVPPIPNLTGDGPIVCHGQEWSPEPYIILASDWRGHAAAPVSQYSAHGPQHSDHRRSCDALITVGSTERQRGA